MTEMAPDQEILFEIKTPLGFGVRSTVSHWMFITSRKHPIMRGRESDVQQTLRTPEQICLSRRDPSVYLFYRKDDDKRWICAVVKRLDGDGFLITAYRTSNIKEGKPIWP